MLIDRDQKTVHYFQTKHLLCVLTLIFAYIVGGLLLDYSKTWMHPEVANLLIPRYMKTGNSFTFADLKEIQNTWAYDHSPRPRYVSIFMTILNVKFRHWLFKVLTPHPSLSLTWIFSLVLTPLTLFGLMRKLFKSNSTALLSVCFYLISVNTLGSLAMLFHPAKPLSNFLFILCLYLGAHLDNAFFTENKKKQTLYLSLLFLALNLGCYTDETFFPVFFALPILYTESFRQMKTRIALFAPFFIFLFYISIFLPIPGEPRSLLQDVFWRGTIHFFGFRPIVLTILHLAKETLFPLGTGWKGLLSALPLFAFSGWCFLHLSTQLKNFELRLLGVAFLYFCFQALLLSRDNVILSSSYCYGGIYPFLAAMVLAPLFTSVSAGRNFLAPIAALTILCTTGYNFERINKRWIDQHQAIYVKMRPATTKGFSAKRELTKESVVTVWKDKNRLTMEASLLPPNAYWLLTEIKDFANR